MTEINISKKDMMNPNPGVYFEGTKMATITLDSPNTNYLQIKGDDQEQSDQNFSPTNKYEQD